MEINIYTYNYFLAHYSKRACPLKMCRINCRYGLQTDANGCNICKCNERRKLSLRITLKYVNVMKDVSYLREWM